MQKCRVFYQHCIVIQRPHCRVLDSAEMWKIAFITLFPVNYLHLKTDCKSKELWTDFTWGSESKPYFQRINQLGWCLIHFWKIIRIILSASSCKIVLKLPQKIATTNHVVSNVELLQDFPSRRGMEACKDVSCIPTRMSIDNGSTWMLLCKHAHIIYLTGSMNKTC